jgi:hypothetical protein
MPTCRSLASLAPLLHIVLLALHLSSSVVYAWRICSQRALFHGTYGQEAALALAQHRTHILRHVWSAFKPGGHSWGHAAYKPFEPYIRCPSGAAQRYGQAGMDGSKLLCPLSGFTSSKDCVVVSLGSNGNYQFEQVSRQAGRAGAAGACLAGQCSWTWCHAAAGEQAGRHLRTRLWQGCSIASIAHCCAYQLEVYVACTTTCGCWAATSTCQRLCDACLHTVTLCVCLLTYRPSSTPPGAMCTP